MRQREVTALRTELETAHARRRAAENALETERAAFREAMASNSQELLTSEESKAATVSQVAKLEKQAADMRVQLNENAAIVRRSQTLEELTVNQKLELNNLREQVAQLTTSLQEAQAENEKLSQTIAREREELNVACQQAKEAKDQAAMMHDSLKESLASQPQSSSEVNAALRDLERKLCDATNELEHAKGDSTRFTQFS